jgi:hypothetical protein
MAGSEQPRSHATVPSLKKAALKETRTERISGDWQNIDSGCNSSTEDNSGKLVQDPPPKKVVNTMKDQGGFFSGLKNHVEALVKNEPQNNQNGTQNPWTGTTTTAMD